MTIETDNVRNEVKEIVDKCIKCGLCKPFCPVLRIVREEQYSPRGQAIMLENNYYERIVFDCNLCKACEKKCPVEIKLCTAIIKARSVINKTKELPETKQIISNLNRTGNIFGKE